MGKTAAIFRFLFGSVLAVLALFACAHVIRLLIVPVHQPAGVAARPPETDAALATTSPGNQPYGEVIVHKADPPFRDETYDSLLAKSHAESHKGLYRRLRVSPEQEPQLREILARQDAAMDAMITRMQRYAMAHPGEKSNTIGVNKSEETKEIDKASEAFIKQLPDTDRRIEALLTPDQRAIYKEYQSNQSVHSAEDYLCDVMMLKAPYLNVENCQRAAEVVVEEQQAYAREHPSTGKPDEFLRLYGPGAGWALKRARERLAREISGEQFEILDAYLTEEQNEIASAQKIALIHKAYGWIDKLGSRINRE